jgi:hypothetical protein
MHGAFILTTNTYFGVACEEVESRKWKVERKDLKTVKTKRKEKSPNYLSP